MNLYLMRHTQPVKGHPLDGTRQLTDAGKVQALDMGAWLKELIGRVDIVICSPMTRSLQTAAIMASALGSHFADTKMLEPDGKPGEAWAEIERLAQQSKDVLIVGHDPNLQGLLLYLTGLDADYDTLPAEAIRFDWGAVASIKGSRLMWLVTPAMVLRPEEEQEVLEAARDLVS